jgi:hypothetical protein
VSLDEMPEGARKLLVAMYVLSGGVAEEVAVPRQVVENLVAVLSLAEAEELGRRTRALKRARVWLDPGAA